MSLVGNLEDLGLGEILQIVSLSRKSGALCLHSRGREGKIIFRHGLVVHATSSSFHENLGELLVQKGVIDRPTLKQALAIQREDHSRERLGAILTKRFSVSSVAIDDMVREQIEKVVYSLFAWAEGTFDFELQDTVDVLDVIHMNPVQFMLEQGLNPQFLAIEGSRLIDEMRHHGELIVDESRDEREEEASRHEENLDLAFDLLQQPATAEESALPAAEEATVFAGEQNRRLVLVDDDEATREALVRFLEGENYTVSPFAKSEDALIEIDTLYRKGSQPVVLTDLIMPRMDGSGILGGLELLELIHTNFADMPVLVMADYHNNDAERKVADMGYPLLSKPRRAAIADEEGMRQFTGLLRAELDRMLGGGRADDVLNTINLGDELRLEMGDELAPSQAPAESTTGISMLRAILEELNNPALGGGIILLVLRFAAEFLNRAIIFIVKRDEIVGLGQFGIVDDAGRADAKVRSIRIPINEDSLFHRVIDTKLPVRTMPDESQWNNFLFSKLGGGTPSEVFLGPIISEGKVVALLYGDNLPENSQIGDTVSLEIFLSQAGMAMEKALLQRKLKEKGQEGT